MFWDKVAWIYDFVEGIYNGKVYRGTGEVVAKEISEDDSVLECACGTGAISTCIAARCKHLIATDMSHGMLKQAEKKLKKYDHVEVKSADINKLEYEDGVFDKVVAGNVIHLLDDPYAALKELLRVCKTEGKVIIPTYINIHGGKSSKAVKVFEKAGAGFKRQFDLESYRDFYKSAGCENVEYHCVEGKMPCAIAVITK